MALGKIEYKSLTSLKKKQYSYIVCHITYLHSLVASVGTKFSIFIESEIYIAMKRNQSICIHLKLSLFAYEFLTY